MKATRKMMAMLGGALLTTGLLAAPSVEITAVQQQYPWTNTVDITYEVRGVTNMEYFVRFTPTTSDDDPILNTEGEASIQVALESNGVFTAQWYPQTNLQYTACKMTPAIFRGGSGGGDDYMIVDLTTGEVTYEPMATQEASNERYNATEYKTKKLVLRKVAAGDYPIQRGTKTAKMDKPYYIGVFETTVAQYNAIMGSGATTSLMPQCGISWNGLRSNALPAARIPDTGSGVIAKLNAKVHAKGNAQIYFDLPTEAMWEVAAHATGKSTDKWHFGDTESDLTKYAQTSAKRNVGLLLPNQWGLYDVYANAGELCRDSVAYAGWNATSWALDTSAMSLTQTPLSVGSAPVWRGGRSGNVSYYVFTSAARHHDHNSRGYTDAYFGFRLAMIVE